VPPASAGDTIGVVKTPHVFLPILLGFSACLPIPRTDRGSPRVLGNYRRADGTPVAGASLAVSTGEKGPPCSGTLTKTVTDSTGHFELPETQVHHSFTMLVGDFMVLYDVCAYDGSQWHKLYRGQSHRDPPKEVVLECTEPIQANEGTCEVRGMTAAP